MSVLVNIKDVHFIFQKSHYWPFLHVKAKFRTFWWLTHSHALRTGPELLSAVMTPSSSVGQLGLHLLMPTHSDDQNRQTWDSCIITWEWQPDTLLNLDHHTYPGTLENLFQMGNTNVESFQQIKWLILFSFLTHIFWLLNYELEVKCVAPFLLSKWNWMDRTSNLICMLQESH